MISHVSEFSVGSMSRIRQRLIKLSQAAFLLLTFVAIIEITLRWAGISYPPRLEPDSVFGMMHRPGLRYWQRDEGLGYVEINSEGFRDREWPITKPHDEFRIAVLGDSYVEAVQVAIEQRFTELISQQLSKEQVFADRTVCVMNFGMAGFGTGQELLLLRDRVEKYRPDVVVLGLLTENDFVDNCRSLLHDNQRPFFVLRDGELTLDDSFARQRSLKNELNRAVATESRLVQAAYEVRRRIRALRGWTPPPATEQPIAPQELSLDDQIYLSPATPAWREAWELTERLLLAIDDEVKKLDAKLLVVTLSNPEQVHPDSQVRSRFMNRLGVVDLTYPDERIARFCDDHGIPVLMLAPPMLKYAEATGAYLHGFGTTIGRGHWNPLGHQVVADLIAGEIVQLEHESKRSNSLGTEAPATANTRPADERPGRQLRSTRDTSLNVESLEHGNSGQNP